MTPLDKNLFIQKIASLIANNPLCRAELAQLVDYAEEAFANERRKQADEIVDRINQWKEDGVLWLKEDSPYTNLYNLIVDQKDECPHKLMDANTMACKKCGIPMNQCATKAYQRNV